MCGCRSEGPIDPLQMPHSFQTCRHGNGVSQLARYKNDADISPQPVNCNVGRSPFLSGALHQADFPGHESICPEPGPAVARLAEAIVCLREIPVVSLVVICGPLHGTLLEFKEENITRSIGFSLPHPGRIRSTTFRGIRPPPDSSPLTPF